MTQNPINALQITVCNTKHTTNTQMHFPKTNNFEHFRKCLRISILSENICTIYQNSIIHILYVLYILL